MEGSGRFPWRIKIKRSQGTFEKGIYPPSAGRERTMPRTSTSTRDSIRVSGKMRRGELMYASTRPLSGVYRVRTSDGAAARKCSTRNFFPVIHPTLFEIFSLTQNERRPRILFQRMREIGHGLSPPRLWEGQGPYHTNRPIDRPPHAARAARDPGEDPFTLAARAFYIPTARRKREKW